MTRPSTRTRLTLAIALAALMAAGSLAAYAAARKPSFTLSASTSPLSVAPGQPKAYKVKVKRIRRFKGAITLKVSKLPRGASARWTLASGRKLPRARRGSGSVLAARYRSAVLTVRTGAETPVGSFRPVVKAVSGRVRRTTKLSLEVRAPAQGTLGVFATPASRDLLQGDRVVFDVALARGGGFDAPVGLSVDGLPDGVSAAVEGPGGGTVATVALEAARDAAPGSYGLTITAAGGGVSAVAPVMLVVKETLPFRIAGDPAVPLVPGARHALDLELTNPHDFELVVTSLEARVAGTDRAGCDAGASFRATPLAALPLTVPPGTSSLSALGVPVAQRPQLELLPSSQDACQGARIELSYAGLASR